MKTGHKVLEKEESMVEPLPPFEDRRMFLLPPEGCEEGIVEPLPPLEDRMFHDEELKPVTLTATLATHGYNDGADGYVTLPPEVLQDLKSNLEKAMFLFMPFLIEPVVTIQLRWSDSCYQRHTIDADGERCDGNVARCMCGKSLINTT